jgi:hypothetical protein
MGHDFSFDFYRIIPSGPAESVPLMVHSSMVWKLVGPALLPTQELPNSIILLSSGSDLSYEIGIWDITTGIGNWLVVATGTLTNNVPSVIPFPFRGARIYVRSTGTTVNSTVLSLKQQEYLAPNSGNLDNSVISQLIALLSGEFTDIIFNTTTSYFDLGRSVVHPTFTAAYSSLPVLAILTDSAGTTPKDVSATSTSFASNGSFVGNAVGDIVNFILTATNSSGTVKIATCPITWLNRTYWGVAAIGLSDPTTLANSALLPSVNNTITVDPSTNQYIYYASRVNSGQLSFWFNGIQGGFSIVDVISVTNLYGISENYYIYMSDLPALTTVKINILPA